MKTFKILLSLLILVGSLELSAIDHKYPEPRVNGGSRSLMVLDPLSGGTITANDLVEAILPPGTPYTNVSTVAPDGLGLFSGGNGASLALDQGLVLGSGCIIELNAGGSGCDIFGLPGDAGLNSLGAGYTTYDAAILEFDFTPETSTIAFDIIYATAEGSSYWDEPCAVFLDGTNIALLPGGSEISFRTIWSSPYFFPNGTIQANLNYYSSTLTIFSPVTPGVQHHMKIAIADGYDQSVPTYLFIGGSTASVPFAWWTIALAMALIIGFASYRFIVLNRG
jgi:hypothetical protein